MRSCLFFILVIAVGESSHRVKRIIGGHYVQKTSLGFELLQALQEFSERFPGRKTTSKEDSPRIPEECERTGICEYGPSDKDALIESIIKDLQRENKTFTNDATDLHYLKNRADYGGDYESLCNVTNKIYAARMIRDSNGEWHTVLNSKKTVVQRFVVETCAYCLFSGC